jgi:hypothetical protein
MVFSVIFWLKKSTLLQRASPYTGYFLLTLLSAGSDNHSTLRWYSPALSSA